MLEGRDRTSGELKWTATVADLVFGSRPGVIVSGAKNGGWEVSGQAA